MGVVTVAWWCLFGVCVVALVRGRTRRAASRSRQHGEGTDDATSPDDERSGPRLPVALRDTAPATSVRRPAFSDFDREILAPLLLADLAPDGVRCPGCVDGSVRRYLHRSTFRPEEIHGDVWCASCRRYTTLSGAGDDVTFDDPLDHLDASRRTEIVRDLEEYLGGLDILWAQGTLPQELRRGAVDA